MRRMNGRTPNFILIGLAFVIFLLTYKCWLLSSENDDLSKEIHKLQSELKMSGQKQEQYERTNQILQGNVHDLDEKQKKFKGQVEEVDQQLEEALSTLKDKENKIIKLNNQLKKEEQSEKDLIQQIDEKDGKIERLISDNQHLLNLNNDAQEALSERDSDINNLKREVEQLKQEFSKNHKEFSEDEKIKEEMAAKSALSPPQPPKLASGNQVGPNYNHAHLAPVHSNAVYVHDIGLGGLKFYPGVPILPVEPRNAVRAKPRFSVADAEKEKIEAPPNQIQEPDSKANLAQQLKSGAIIGDNRDSNQANNVIPNPPIDNQNNQIFQSDNFINGVIEKPNNKASLLANLPQEVGNPVLPEPNIQHNNVPHDQLALPVRNPIGLMPPNSLEDNPDAAMDEDRKAVEDPADDQDEEGKEIKRDLDNSYEKGEGNPHADEANDGGGAGDDESGGRHEPLGIGAKQEIPRHEGEEDIDGGQKGVGEDDVNLEDDANHHGNERVYEANLDHKIRNLGRQ